ncbi:hypothetical protein GWI33_006917 [Rhynchophorus ferrugineus]|uniref:Odorant receptor n=1 Tax=Rhynchophorus ferrugineus TaxID=354439 RepID=A0A834MNV3_RHYFE|nr:hypothetical protein GWI33_006917 [Rhynchophorus ferrugineus]
MIGCNMHTYYVIRNNIDIDIDIDIAMSVSMLGIIWVNCLFVKNQPIFLEMIRSFSDFRTFKKPPGYDEFNQKMNFYTKLHLIYVHIGGMSYFTIFSYFRYKKCVRINQERSLNEICLLFSNIHMPFDVNFFPAVEIIAALQLFSSVYVYFLCGSILWTNVELVEHLGFRMRDLKRVLLEVFKEQNLEKQRRKFGYAIRYHNELLRVGKLLDKFYGIELILHVTLTGMTLGCCAFAMINNNSLDTLILFIGWLFAIVISCIAGQRLLDETSTLPDILYETDWYNLDVKLQKDLVLFLCRSNRPMEIKAGTIVMRSALIIQILKTAYSCLTLLSSVK